MTPPPDEWTVPDPEPRRRIRGWSVTIGIVAGLIGHVVTLLITVPASGPSATTFTPFVIAQAVYLVVAVTAAVLLMTLGDRGLGMGLLIGWGAGLVVVPDVGIGACFAAANGSSS